MKKLLLLVVTLTTFNAKSQTSVYHPFPEDSATWCAGLCGDQGNGLQEATYQLSGKVLINGNWFSRMLHYERYCYGVGSCYCGLIYSIDTTTYYIRQDTTQKKVWIYIPATNSDTIFLDFNLNVGDTIDGRNEYWAEQIGGSALTIVTSIDSVLIGSQYRTRYNYTYQGFQNSMIEGIGPTHGLFYLANQGYDYMTALNIFSQNNQVFYPYYLPDTTGIWQSCYDFTTGIGKINEPAFISSFPNPSTGNFTLKFGQYLSKGSIEIYSAIGEQVWNENIYNESKKEIQLKNICDGIYFVKVFDEDKIFTQKIIIQ